jgi:hypothetical protein
VRKESLDAETGALQYDILITSPLADTIHEKKISEAVTARTRKRQPLKTVGIFRADYFHKECVVKGQKQTEHTRQMAIKGRWPQGHLGVHKE